MWDNGGIALPFLTSALDGDEWSASLPGCFTTGENAPDTRCVGGWVQSRSGRCEEHKDLDMPGTEAGLSSL
jgi:hypothetical protein